MKRQWAIRTSWLATFGLILILINCDKQARNKSKIKAAPVLSKEIEDVTKLYPIMKQNAEKMTEAGWKHWLTENVIGRQLQFHSKGKYPISVTECDNRYGKCQSKWVVRIDIEGGFWGSSGIAINTDNPAVVNMEKEEKFEASGIISEVRGGAGFPLNIELLPADIVRIE